MKQYTKIAVIGAALAATVALTAAGCEDTAAKKASENTSIAADNFEVQRKIVGINTRTDKPIFYVEGRCSIERAGDLIVTCKHGDNDYRKHYLGQATDVAWTAFQMKGIDVSVYHTRIILRPETILPELEVDMGKQ